MNKQFYRTNLKFFLLLVTLSSFKAFAEPTLDLKIGEFVSMNSSSAVSLVSAELNVIASSETTTLIIPGCYSSITENQTSGLYQNIYSGFEKIQIKALNFSSDNVIHIGSDSEIKNIREEVKSSLNTELPWICTVQTLLTVKIKFQVLGTSEIQQSSISLLKDRYGYFVFSGARKVYLSSAEKVDLSSLPSASH